MTQEQILEGNKLIAAFMDVEPEVEYCVGHPEQNTICYSPKNCYFSSPTDQKAECERWLKEQARKYPNGWVTKEGYTTRRFEWFQRYHQDWNLLMPVVEKIEAAEDKHLQVTIWGGTCNIWDLSELGIVANSNHKSKLLATWISVVDCIKWLNSLDTVQECNATNAK